MSDQDLICVCMTVTRGEITAAVQSGITTVEGLKNTLMCCTGCGTCQSRVEKVLADTLAVKASTPKKEVA